MSKSAKTASLLEQAKKLTSPSTAWENALPPDTRNEVVEVLQAQLNHEIQLSLPQLIKLFTDHGLKVTRHGLRGALERLNTSNGE